MQPIKHTISNYSRSDSESLQKTENANSSAKKNILEKSKGFLTDCKQEGLVDENYRLLLQPDSFLPDLFDTQKMRINQFLETEIFSIKIWEILAHFSYVAKSIDIVGGFLRQILLLDPYINKTLSVLGAKVIPQDLNKSRHLPDVDIRFRLRENQTSVKDCTQALANFIAKKLSVSPAWVRSHCFTKFNFVNMGKTEYSIATFGEFYLDEHRAFPSELECLFVKSLERESLFVQDDLKINILPLILAKMGYALRPTLRCESHYNKGWQAFFDLVGGVIHVNHPKSVDANGFLMLASYFSRGYILGDDRALEGVSALITLREQFLACDIPKQINLLKKCLKNHHESDSIAWITMMFHLHQHLSQFLPEETLLNFWKNIGPSKMDICKEATTPLYLQEAFQRCIPYQVIHATVVLASSFLLAHASSKVCLISQQGQPFLRIKIADNSAPYLLLPFQPLQAMQILFCFDKDHAAAGKALIPLFFSIVNPFLKGELNQETKLSSVAFEDAIPSEKCEGFFLDLEKFLHTKSPFRPIAFYLLLSTSEYGKHTEILLERFPEMLFNEYINDKGLLLLHFSKMVALINPSKTTPFLAVNSEVVELLSKPKAFIKYWILHLAHSQKEEWLTVSYKLWRRFVAKFTKKSQFHFTKEAIDALLPKGLTLAREMMVFLQKECSSLLSLKHEAGLIEKLLLPSQLGSQSIISIFAFFLQRLEKQPIGLKFMENAIFAFLKKILQEGYLQEGEHFLRTLTHMGVLPTSDERAGFLWSTIVSLEAKNKDEEKLDATWKYINSLGIPLDNVAKVHFADYFLQKATLKERGFQLLEGMKTEKKPHPNVLKKVQPLMEKHLNFLLQSEVVGSHDKAVRLLSKSYKLYLPEQQNLDYTLKLLEKYLAHSSFEKALVLWQWALRLAKGSQPLAKMQECTNRFLKALQPVETVFPIAISMINHSDFFLLISSLHHPNRFLERASMDKIPSILCPILSQISDRELAEPVEFLKFFHHLQSFLENTQKLPEEVLHLLSTHSGAIVKNLLKADSDSCSAFLQILANLFSHQNIYPSLVSKLLDHFEILSSEEQLVAFQKCQTHLLKGYSVGDLTEKLESLIEKINQKPFKSSSIILKTLQHYPQVTIKFFAKLLALWALSKAKVDDALLIETFKILIFCPSRKASYALKRQEDDTELKKPPLHFYVCWQSFFKILANLKSEGVFDLIAEDTLHSLNCDQKSKLCHFKVIIQAIISTLSKKETLSLKQLENVLHFLSKIVATSSLSIKQSVLKLEEKLLQELLPLCTSETFEKMANYISYRLEESTLSKIFIQSVLKIGYEKGVIPNSNGPIVKIATLAKEKSDHHAQLEIANTLLLYKHPATLPILEKYLLNFLATKADAVSTRAEPISDLGDMIYRFAIIVTKNQIHADSMFKLLSHQEITQYIDPKKLSLLWSWYLCEQNAKRINPFYIVENYHKVKHDESALIKWAETICDLVAPMILEKPSDFYKLIVSFFDALAEDSKPYAHKLQENSKTPVFSVMGSRDEKFCNRFFHCMNRLINKIMKLKITTPNCYTKFNNFIYFNLKKMIEQLPFKRKELADTLYEYSFWIIPDANDYFDVHTGFVLDLLNLAIKRRIFIDKERFLSEILIYINNTAIKLEIQPQLIMNVMNRLVRADNPFAIVQAIKIILSIQEFYPAKLPFTELKYLYKIFIAKIPQYSDFVCENVPLYEWIANSITKKELNIFLKSDSKVGLKTTNELIQQLFETMMDVIRTKKWNDIIKAELIIFLFPLLLSTRKWGAFSGPQGNNLYYSQIEKITPFFILLLKEQLALKNSVDNFTTIIQIAYLAIRGIEDTETDLEEVEGWKKRRYSSKIQEKRASILIQWLIDLCKTNEQLLILLSEPFYELAKKQGLLVGKNVKKKCKEFIELINKQKADSNFAHDSEILKEVQEQMENDYLKGGGIPH